MNRKRKTYSRLLAKYIKINFIVIFLPVVISSIIYCYVNQNNYTEKYLGTVEYSVNEKKWKMETKLKSFASTAQQISMDSELTPYHLAGSAYTTVNAIDRLKSYTAESIYFKDMAIYLNDSDKLYTSKGVVDIDTFISLTYKPIDDFTEEEFLKLICSKKYFDSTKDQQYVLAGSTRYSIMTYPLGKTAGRAYGTLIGIYESDWEETFGISEGNDERLVLVCTNSLDILFSRIPEKVKQVFEKDNGTEVLGNIVKNWDEQENYYEFVLDGVTYIGKMAYSSINGQYLIDTIEKSVVSRAVIMMQLPMLIIIFITMFFLTVFLSILLSFYNYRPIQKLYNLFEKKEGRKKTDNENDELLFLNQYIRELLEEKVDMGEQIENSRKNTRKEFVRNLLRGNLDISLPIVQERMKNLEITLENTCMSVIVIDDHKDRKHDVRGKIENILQNVRIREFHWTENIYKNYDACLLCMDDEACMMEFAGQLLEEFEINTDLKIGIGNVYYSPESLKYSLMEAVIAMDNIRDRQVVLFTDLAAHKCEEYYCKPLENELKLKQLINQGMAENLDEILEGLQKELLRIWRFSSETVVFFLMNRIMSSMFEDALNLNEYEVEKYLYFTDVDEFISVLRDFCKIELNYRLARKASEQDERMQSILQYVDEHYMMQGMSLTMVADKFGMTSSYLSKLFKAAAEKNFIDYITEKRLHLAAELLIESDALVSEIVEKVGYTDVANFTRKFSQYFRMSPGKFRKLERERRKN